MFHRNARRLSEFPKFRETKRVTKRLPRLICSTFHSTKENGTSFCHLANQVVDQVEVKQLFDYDQPQCIGDNSSNSSISCKVHANRTKSLSTVYANTSNVGKKSRLTKITLELRQSSWETFVDHRNSNSKFMSQFISQSILQLIFTLKL